jgi:hypothetical protein
MVIPSGGSPFSPLNCIEAPPKSSNFLSSSGSSQDRIRMLSRVEHIMVLIGTRWDLTVSYGISLTFKRMSEVAELR